jgi:S-adenosyl methyltransferase
VKPDVQLNSDVAHPARVYDYILGGKDNFRADRDLGDKLMQMVHGIQTSMRANRAFMARMARFLAAEPRRTGSSTASCDRCPPAASSRCPR